MGQFRRRRFLAATGALLAAPFAAVARREPIPVVGVLQESSTVPTTRNLTAFRAGLREGGFTEGQNVAFLYRWAEGHYARLPALAAELVQRRVSVIATGGGPRSALAAKSATTKIPVVFTVGVDPASVGLVVNLARPEANATGVTMFTTVLTTKRLELLREMVPGLKTIAFLVNPNNPNAAPQISELEALAGASRQQLHVVRVATERDLESAFAEAARQRADGLIVSADPFLGAQSTRLVALATRYAIPTIYQWSYFAERGGLISYGSIIHEAYRQSGIYVGRILDGVKPGDLPVLQPTRFELVVNLKAARALRLTVPQSILMRADRVIE